MATATPHGRRRKRFTGNNGVILVDIGRESSPRDERLTPRHFTGGRPFRSRLALKHAIAAAVEFNRAQMQAVDAGTFDGQWAMVTFSLVAPPDPSASMSVETKGGAT